MERYKNHSFKNDPAVSAEYVKFLVMNTGMDAINVMVKHNDVLKLKVETLTSQVKVADAKSATAPNAVSEQKKLIMDLSKKVDSMIKSSK
jgi:recombination DNA repair RAD52 pathway protein